MQLTVLFALLAAAPTSSGILSEPIPGAVAPATAPAMTTVDGVRVTMVTATSKTPPADLVAHYTEVFQKQGLYFADELKDVEMNGTLQVTALDPDNMLSYTVLIQPKGKGLSTVIVSTSELAKKPQPSTTSWAPVLPNAQGLSTAELEWMQTITYDTVATPAEVKAFYREEFAKLGFKEVSDLEFTRGTEHVTLNVSPGVSTRGVMLVKQDTSQEKDEDEAPAPPPTAPKKKAAADAGHK